jgi:hypothetical protein
VIQNLEHFEEVYGQKHARTLFKNVVCHAERFLGSKDPRVSLYAALYHLWVDGIPFSELDMLISASLRDLFVQRIPADSHDFLMFESLFQIEALGPAATPALL